MIKKHLNNGDGSFAAPVNYSAGVGPSSVAIADLDGDTLPDGWEAKKGTDPLKDDAGDDPDGDGYGNAEEYEKDSHPRDPDDFPFAEDDEITTDMNQPVTADITGNDGGEWASLVSLIQPDNGAAVIGSTNAVSYTPAGNFWGTDVFAYTVTNSRGNQAKATVTATFRALTVTLTARSTPLTNSLLLRMMISIASTPC